MPICKRNGFDNLQIKSKDETFQDNEEVFYCSITKEIFRDYEEYFRHVMVINSTVWQCEATGRDNLTYAEALKSERIARKKMELFKDSLRPPVMLVVEHAKQSSIKALNAIVLKFLRKRYFLNEEVMTTQKSTKNTTFNVIEIIPSENFSVNGVYEDTENLQYRLRMNGNGKTELVVPFDQIRRQRTEFTTENLQMFVKNNVTRIDGILHPKPESYKQYITDRKITFSNIFIGKIPYYTPAKIKRPSPDQNNKKQATLNKYLVKNGEQKNDDDQQNGKKQTKAEKAEAKGKSLKEEMERIRLEKREEVARLEKQKAEKRAKLLERVDAECTALLTKGDDLERTDQRVLPTFTPIETYIPSKLLGDAFMVREFLHSFTGILSGIQVFRSSNLSFYEMSRSFTAREVAGPLSDILLILVGTIFDLQKEEEEECDVEYITGRDKQDKEPYKSMADAARCHFYAKRHFTFKINELPLDALTLSEVLRLHLLSSGARVKDRAEKWRVMYRNGYGSSEDPGLDLRIKHAHILRALKMYPVYQFPFKDIMRIIRCLMSQILSYSSTINIIEERMEQAGKARSELRTIMANENRRLNSVKIQNQAIKNEYNQECMKDDVKDDIDKKKALEEKLNKKIAENLAQSDRDRRKHEKQVEKMNSALFNFLIYLGMDRAYRKYYVLESMPGIFVEHPLDSMDTCLSDPPKNVPIGGKEAASAVYPKNRKELRMYLIKLYENEDKQTTSKQSQENKENLEHHINGLKIENEGPGIKTEEAIETNAEVVEDEKSPIAPPQLPPTQYELYMCTGDRNNCIVHDENNVDRKRWAYLYKPEDIDALMQSLNKFGSRESELLEQLTTLRELIDQHVQKCPTDMLEITDDKLRKKFKTNMMLDTNRKYYNANFRMPEETHLNEVICESLVEKILQFENEIYSGDLGRLKVENMEKWRTDLFNRKYDPQAKLQWGTNYTKKENAIVEQNNIISDDEVEVDPDGGQYANRPYRDPGATLGNSLEIESEDSSDDEISLHDSEDLRTSVKNLASALLQVEQAIERRFLKEPFGISNMRETSKERIEAKQREGLQRLKQWEVSLMESTSYSQIFLHLNILHDCIIWARSTNKSMCQVCRRGHDPDKMLLCDECNGGTHMFCMKPKMKTIPEGNWYCNRCVKRLGLKNESNEHSKKEKNKRKREFIVDEEDADATSETSNASTHSKGNNSRRTTGRRTNKRLKSSEIEEALESESEEVNDENDEEEDVENGELDGGENDLEDVPEPDESVDNDEENEQNDSVEDDERFCMVCSYDGSDLTCMKCHVAFHLECVNLKRHPRQGFVCQQCKQSDNKRNKSAPNDDSDNDDSDEPRTKRPRQSRTSLRNSLPNGNVNNNNNNTNNNNNNRRSHRRTNDNLPLNSSALYELLEQTMKHEKAWPFLRPVSQSEVPDYHLIIKSPMDLAKVKSKLNMGKYQLNEEVLNDIQLIFRNCDLYNVEGNEIYEAGCTLEKFVIEKCTVLNLPFKPSEMNEQYC